MKLLIVILSVIILSGCGKTVYVTEYTPDEDTPTQGDALIINTTNGSTTNVTYTTVEDGGVLIDCGEGGCGGVYISKKLMK